MSYRMSFIAWYRIWAETVIPYLGPGLKPPPHYKPKAWTRKPWGQVVLFVHNVQDTTLAAP